MATDVVWPSFLGRLCAGLATTVGALGIGLQDIPKGLVVMVYLDATLG